MRHRRSTRSLAAVMLSGALMLAASAAQAVDADAAQALARQNNCFKCHSVEKEKDGPSFKKSAAKLKGRPEAVERIVQHLTTGEKAKFPDGHEEEHKVIKAKSPDDVKNLAEWILQQ
jgi:cytochrome c